MSDGDMPVSSGTSAAGSMAGSAAMSLVLVLSVSWARAERPRRRIARSWERIVRRCLPGSRIRRSEGGSDLRLVAI